MSSGQKRRIPANFPNMNYRRRAELRHVQRSWAQAFIRVLAGLDAWMLAQWDDIPTDGSVEIRRPPAAIPDGRR